MRDPAGCRIISHLEAGPGSAIIWLNIKEEVGIKWRVAVQVRVGSGRDAKG